MPAYESVSFEIYIKEAGCLAPLTRKQEKAIGRKIEKGDQAALETLVVHNLRFVIHQARMLARYGVNMDDLVQAGAIGMMTAARRFDYRRGVKFISYADLYVKQQMQEWMANGQWSVRLPANTMGSMRMVSVALESLLQQGNNNPSISDVAKIAGCHKSLVAGVMAARAKRVSLDDPITDYSQDSRKDLLVGDSVSPSASIEKTEMQALIARVMDNLPPVERDILSDRFGMGTGEAKTLEKIGIERGISRERVRQLEREAKERLVAYMDPALLADLGAIINLAPAQCERVRKSVRQRRNARRLDHNRARVRRGEYNSGMEAST